MIWKLFNFLNKKYPISTSAQPIVVLGFQRSGTSLLGQILGSLNVYFGQMDHMKKNDFRNPKGFFENERIFKVLRSMLSQAGIKNEFGTEQSLEAKGFLRRIRRFISRIELQKELFFLSSKERIWGVKSFPILFYYLKSYLPKQTQCVAIYRDPFSVAESFMKSWEGGRYSFQQVLSLWTKANKDLLYHLNTNDSVLICYEDLFISEKRKSISKVLSNFLKLDLNKVEEAIEKNIDNKLNRSSKKIDLLKKNYPLTREVVQVYEALEFLKVK